MAQDQITTCTSLAVDSSSLPNSKVRGFYTDSLTQPHIDAIPADILRPGAFVFNITTNLCQITTLNDNPPHPPIWSNILTTLDPAGNFVLTNLDDDPVTPLNGMIYYDTAINQSRSYNGSWNTVLTGTSAGPAHTTGNATIGASAPGIVNIATTAVTANSIILLTRKTAAGTIGNLTYAITIPGTTFTINSDNVLDTSIVSWLIINV